jgi:hypothetical protein
MGDALATLGGPSGITLRERNWQIQANRHRERGSLGAVLDRKSRARAQISTRSPLCPKFWRLSVEQKGFELVRQTSSLKFYFWSSFRPA